MKGAKSLLAVGIVTAGLLISFGYVSLSNDLTSIMGTRKNKTVTNTDVFDVEIVSVDTNEVNGVASKDDASFTKSSATFNSTILQKGDSIVYSVKIKNNGNKAAKLNDANITEKEGGSEAIFYAIDAPEEVLEPGEVTSMTVVATYDENYLGQVTSTTKAATATVEYEPAE